MHWFTNLKHNKFILLTAIILCTGTSTLNAQIQESFDNVAGLEAAGWIFASYSDNSTSNESWFQGNGNIFSAHSGSDSSYIASSSTGIDNYVCNWLVMPDLGHTDQLSFYTRGAEFAKIAPRIRLFVLYSPAGSINPTNCATAGRGGAGNPEVLLEINPNQEAFGFPTDWTQYTVDVNGSGQIAFVYYVEGIGSQDFNGGYFGIDSVNRGGTLPPPVQSVPSLNIIGLLMLVLALIMAVYLRGKYVHKF